MSEEEEFFLNADINYFSKLLEEAKSKNVSTFKIPIQHFERISEGEKNLHIWQQRISANVSIDRDATDFIVTVH